LQIETILFDSSETQFLGDSVPPRDLLEWEHNGGRRTRAHNICPCRLWRSSQEASSDRYKASWIPPELNAVSLLNAHVISEYASGGGWGILICAEW